jgi:hypothetical protein
MSIEVAKYRFQSWVRKGIATQISEQDVLGNPAVVLPPGERPTVPIGVSINSTPQEPKSFALIGPADIIGIHRDMIVRTEPRERTVDFEPNYLAFIEFYDEDFLWRYSPAKPDGERLRPWISLLVLKQDEFVRDDRRLPLPVVTVKRKEALPNARDCWMFAHAHVDDRIPDAELPDLERYLKSLQATFTTDPDKMYSRLLSARHLDPNASYHAFLVPTFEGGRLSGLGLPTTGVPAQKGAWDGSASVELPFYFDWSFHTGEKVDFEALLELIEPRVLDERIGARSMDCKKPGFVLVDDRGRLRPGGESGLPGPSPEIQGLEGALKTDRTKSNPKTFTPNAFQDELQILVNLPETITADFDAVPGTDDDLLNDPIVTLPFYGQNHARQHKSDKILLDVAQSGWLHDLNRDPRTRVPAGIGTLVVQKNQEKLMQRAWQQVQKVYEANRIVRGFRFITEISTLYSTQFFAAISPAKFMAVTVAVHAKVLGSPTTVRHQLQASALRAPVFSSAFRRLTRPTGKLAQRLNDASTPLHFGELVEAVNTRRADPAPPREVPAGLASVDNLANRIRPRRFDEWMRFLIRHRSVVLGVAFALILLAGLVSGAWILSAVLGAGAVGAYRWLMVQVERDQRAAVLTDPAKAIQAIQAAPARPNFTVRIPGEADTPPATPGPIPGGDSVEAANFRQAVVQLQQRLAVRLPEPVPLLAFDMNSGYAKVARAVAPRLSFPLRLSALVQIPNVSFKQPEEIVEAMAHPDFEDAMYAHLRDISKELLIPNLELIPPNTISVLETNPRFIESYLVGLNHEMARELLWREYPTDMRGSYFRQFWEVKGVSNPDTPSDAEKLKDVTKLHTWASVTPLGSHKPDPGADADVQPGENQLVVVIRGELLKRYPNTVVYAQKAILDAQGNIAIDEKDVDPKDFDRKFKFPLFRAEIEPDLRFFGFDLTTHKARGTVESKQFPDDKLGWFFVIQEVPGEPRFGMDLRYRETADADPEKDPDTWNNLAWDLFGEAEPAFVASTPPPVFKNPDLASLGEHVWARSAADMAFILFQTPVMVAVHANEMLPPEQP